MKIGIISKPNQKGQVVIPKSIRDTLGITQDTSLNIVLRGNGLYIYPIDEVKGLFDDAQSYASILRKTQGSWGEESPEEKARNKAHRDLELKASKLRKQQW